MIFHFVLINLGSGGRSLTGGRDPESNVVISLAQVRVSEGYRNLDILQVGYISEIGVLEHVVQASDVAVLAAGKSRVRRINRIVGIGELEGVVHRVTFI